MPVTGTFGAAMGLCIVKRREFARWQKAQGVADAALCMAAREIDAGLVDANLGGFLYKKRIARDNGGKRGGYRTLVSMKVGERYVFLHGFAKSATGNISQAEASALRYAGKVFLNLSGFEFEKALSSGVLLRVFCNEQDH